MEQEATPLDPGSYRVRNHAFVAERTYRLTEDALTWQEDGKPLDGVFYDKISEVRLAYAPTRVSRNRYRTQVIFREGGMAEFFNTTYVGLADLPEQNAQYIAFLTGLHEVLATKGKDVRYRQGNSMAAYVGNWLLMIFIAAMLVLAALLLFTWGGTWMVVVKLAIIAFFIPTLIRYMKNAKPGDYDPRALPADVLPSIDGVAVRP